MDSRSGGTGQEEDEGLCIWYSYSQLSLSYLSTECFSIKGELSCECNEQLIQKTGGNLKELDFLDWVFVVEEEAEQDAEREGILVTRAIEMEKEIASHLNRQRLSLYRHL